jgi:uncharacterized phage protein gp47/JayE
MAIEYKSEAELNALCISELAREGKITNLTEGSRARALLQIINRRLGEIYGTLRFNVAMGFLTSATGIFLDLLGSVVGLVRRTSSQALMSREDEVIKFYVATGTLAAKIPSKVIPIGTIIQNSAGSIQYKTTEASIFDDVTDKVFVAAASINSGSSSNVGVNVLTVHSLGIADVFVTNARDISTGSDIESDDNYRYRIANSRAIRESANLTAVRIAMLPVPGVSNVVIREYPGYMDALIIPAGNFVTESVVKACQFLGEREKAGGVRLFCRGPAMVPYEVYTQIQMAKGTPSSEQLAIKDNVRAAIISYLDQVPLGGNMVLRQLEGRIQNSDPKVYDHRIVCLTFQRRPQLLRNYRLREDELFMPDPESENAVVVAAV